MAAPAFIAKGTKADAINASSVAPTFPVSIALGQLLFILAVLDDDTGSIQTPSGFSDVPEHVQTAIATDISGYLFYKIADGTESGTITVTGTGLSGGLADYIMAQIYQFSGSNISLTDSDSTKGTSATVTWDATTVSNSASTLAAFVINWDSATNPDTPTGYTASATDGSVAISNLTIELNTKENTSSGVSTTAGNGSSNGWATWHVSFYNQIASRSFIVN